MHELIRLINHPGVPWPAGGILGGIAGYLLGQPDCSTIPCDQALLPVLEVPLAQEAWAALGTVLGALAGAIYQVASKE